MGQAEIGPEGRRAPGDQPPDQIGRCDPGPQPAAPGPGDIGLEDLAFADAADYVGDRVLIGLGRRDDLEGVRERRAAGGGRGGRGREQIEGLFGPRPGRFGGGRAAHGDHPQGLVVEGQHRRVEAAGQLGPVGMAAVPRRFQPRGELVAHQAGQAPLERRTVRI